MAINTSSSALIKKAQQATQNKKAASVSKVTTSSSSKKSTNTTPKKTTPTKTTPKKSTTNKNTTTKTNPAVKQNPTVETYNVSEAIGTISDGPSLLQINNGNIGTNFADALRVNSNVSGDISDINSQFIDGMSMQELLNQQKNKTKKKNKKDTKVTKIKVNKKATKKIKDKKGKLSSKISTVKNTKTILKNLTNDASVTPNANVIAYGAPEGTGIGAFSYKEMKTDGFTTQGVTEAGNYYYVTGYSKDGKKSRIYLYDRTTGAYSGYIVLNSTAHVGGITYDKDHGLLFVTGDDGSVECLNYNNLNRAIEIAGTTTGCLIDLSNPSYSGSAIYVKCDISVKDKTHVGKAATVYYKNGKIYVSTFDGVNKGEMVEFNFNYDAKKGKITSSVGQKIAVPKQTQGLAITEYQGSNYIVTTQSIGSAQSNILVYKLNNNGTTEYQGKIYLDKGIEGINIDDSGNIVAVFEKGSGNTYSANMADLMNSLSKVENHEVEKLASEIGQRYNNKRSISTIA